MRQCHTVELYRLVAVDVLFDRPMVRTTCAADGSDIVVMPSRTPPSAGIARTPVELRVLQILPVLVPRTLALALSSV